MYVCMYVRTYVRTYVRIDKSAMDVRHIRSVSIFVCVYMYAYTYARFKEAPKDLEIADWKQLRTGTMWQESDLSFSADAVSESTKEVIFLTIL